VGQASAYQQHWGSAPACISIITHPLKTNKSLMPAEERHSSKFFNREKAFLFGKTKSSIRKREETRELRWNEQRSSSHGQGVITWAPFSAWRHDCAQPNNIKIRHLLSRWPICDRNHFKANFARTLCTLLTWNYSLLFNCTRECVSKRENI